MRKIQEEPLQASSAPDQAPVFALDIGTRSVIGIVGRPQEELFCIEAVEAAEHAGRAVIDGQIEDIEEAAESALSVKRRLEERLGYELHEVYVAAAGRALRTQRAQYAIMLPERSAIEEERISELVSFAIQAAYEQVAQEESGEQQNLLCVGHSVVRYWLDGYELSSLLHHRGTEIRVEVIATFLPAEVVESLYEVMGRVGLTVSGITLEPIAAMNAVIPRELRTLNLALVDVGGGTSDIAVSKEGSVAAYTMATVAGDEITEAIMQGCLTDFSTAERMKRQLGDPSGTIPYDDVLGLPHECGVRELLDMIRPTVEGLAGEVARQILEANGTAPAAVFLVGGGSRAPELRELLAERLGVEPSKVAVGGGNYMKRTVTPGDAADGPEFATPLGIALTAVAQRTGSGLSVLLNGKKVALLKREPATLLEVLLLGGYQHDQILGRSGSPVVYEQNGERTVVRGSPAAPGEAWVNGAAASISSPVEPGDEVRFSPASTGADAAPTVASEFPDFRKLPVSLNGFDYQAGTKVRINGREADPACAIGEGDSVQVLQIGTLSEFCRSIDFPAERYVFWVNGEERDGSYELRPGDRIQTRPRDTGPPGPPRRSPAESGAPDGKRLRVQINGTPFALEIKEDGTPYQFVDMFNYVEIDPQKPQGNIVLLRNGHPASYLEPILEGDRIDIYWDRTAGSAES